MTEFDSICLELKSKQSLELLDKLLSYKKEMLIKSLLTSTDKDKCWETKLQVNFIESFKREIGSKANEE